MALAGPAAAQYVDPLDVTLAAVAASVCPDAQNGTVTVTSADTGCFNFNFGNYSRITNLVIAEGGAISPSTGTPIVNSPGGAVGTITILGTLNSRPTSGAIINFRAETTSVGAITVGTNGKIGNTSGGAPNIDLRNMLLLNGGFKNDGEISARAIAPFLALSGNSATVLGRVEGSIINNRNSTTDYSFLSSSREVITGNIENNGLMTVDKASAFALDTTAIQGNLINSGQLTGQVGSGFDLRSGTNVSGALINTNTGQISGFDVGISAVGTTLAGGISNSGTIEGKSFGIRPRSRSAGFHRANSMRYGAENHRSVT